MHELTLFHTAEVHRQTFDALAERIASGAQLSHVVRPDWLERAQNGMDTRMRTEIADAVGSAKNALCTCTTIGEVAEDAGALRIDWPMMQKAAGSNGPTLLVYCLESTKAPSKALLERAYESIGVKPMVETLPLTDLWELFEKGSVSEFHRAIAERISDALLTCPGIASVVLAQASMAGTATLIQGNIPVLSSPETALKAALGLPDA